MKFQKYILYPFLDPYYRTNLDEMSFKKCNLTPNQSPCTDNLIKKKELPIRLKYSHSKLKSIILFQK